MKTSQTFTFNQTSLPAVVAAVLSELETFTLDQTVVLALRGDLGAGKTTFTQELARQLGVTEVVNSPTFTIMKGYETTHKNFAQLVHMDAYRIEDEKELGPLRFKQLLATPHTLLCLEWPEKISTALPAEYLQVTLTICNETDRIAQVDRCSV